MAVLNNADSTVSNIDDVQLDTSSPANINYVKARMAIEAAGYPRAKRRACKMEVISYLKGEIRHQAVGKPNMVDFRDGTSARF